MAKTFDALIRYKREKERERSYVRMKHFINRKNAREDKEM